jgi:hypothetical protein
MRVMRRSLASLDAVAYAVLTLAVGCGAGVDDSTASASGDELVAESADALSAPEAFVRSDQVHLGRAPSNTLDLQDLVAPNFAHPAEAAARVVARHREHPTDARPIYLGNIHSWVYNADVRYRADLNTLAAAVDAGTGGRRVLFYFEEENASTSPQPVAEEHAGNLRFVTSHATLLMATYANGRQTHAEESAAVAHMKAWYHGRLGIPMTRMMIDLDTSQTPSSAYYGSRGDLAAFDRVVAWTLESAYVQGFAGFHTMGNSGSSAGTSVASDATYVALDAAWRRLESAHQGQTKFIGVR